MALATQISRTITIQEPPSTSSHRSKKIKLTHKKSTSESILDYTSLLDSSANINESMGILMKISDCMQFDETEELIDGIKKLSEFFRKTEAIVRAKILHLFGDFASELGVDGNFLVEEILNLLKTEDSKPKVFASALSVLYKIGNCQTLPSGTLARCVEFAKAKLSSYSHNVQRHALFLIGALATIPDSENELLDLISKYTDSQDARVRAQAFSAILDMSSRGVKLPPSLYPRAVKALKDDYECVRKEALKLIYEIGIKHAEHPIVLPNSNGEEIRLIDDAFGKVCSEISDLSMNIRQQAAQLLGGMIQVSSEFLLQTLDKKLMSNMRRKKSLHERAFENYTSGEWSSGKKWADDAPKELVKSDSISLIDSGACGALVQGLEDEFLEVRMSSVHSMCQLALTNPPFAVICLDFLVDMFNDEIENVRLEAIYSLTKISRHIILREDQLEIMLSSLEDYSVEVREGLHIMLGACKVSTKACLNMVIQKVLDVLSKYPQDKLSAFGCMQRVGQKHPELCMALTSQMLQDHPFFDIAERDVEDPSYVCILIMLFNAAQHLNPIMSLFPDTTIKHYGYLRDTMPKLVPYLPLGDQTDKVQLKLKPTSDTSKQFLETLLANLQTTYSAPKARQALLQAAQENLDRLATIHPQLSGTAFFTADFLGALLLIEQLQSCIMPHHNRLPTKESLNQLIRKCLKLHNLFSNLTTEDLSLVKQICLRASALNLILIVKDKSQSALAPCQLLLHIAADASNFFQDHSDIVPDSFTTSILSQLASVNDPKPGKVFREILPIVQSSTPVGTPQINVNIKMCTATILEPSELNSTENIVKVTAGLIAALPIVAEIENLQDHQKGDLRIKIKYPDQNQNVVVPRLRDLKKMMNNSGEEMEHNWKLRTQVLLSHGIWTEACQVEISICLSVKPSSNSELELCKPIKVLFAPKPIKRGI